MTAALSKARPVQPSVVIVSSGALCVLAFLSLEYSWRMPTLLGLGALLGLVLYNAAFGFTAAYRRLIVDRDPTAVRAQVVMLGVATLLFAPTLAGGQGIGKEFSGAKAPLGI